MSLTASSPDHIAKAASLAALALASVSAGARNDALTAIHSALARDKESILAANVVDLKRASQSAADGHLSQSLVKRLDLGRKGKFDDMLAGILDVRDLDDPREFDVVPSSAPTALVHLPSLSRIASMSA